MPEKAALCSRNKSVFPEVEPIGPTSGNHRHFKSRQTKNKGKMTFGAKRDLTDVIICV